ncbi:hypothetical protein V496_03495 [Pseudogymnoascus sp. VKM F-4515 (FW-2607)]|nr:hypothetical protein V496_03495 [Pseudogymnoascus sp. VKM F-4515 (FW-2607)]
MLWLLSVFLGCALFTARGSSGRDFEGRGASAAAAGGRLHPRALRIRGATLTICAMRGSLAQSAWGSAISRCRSPYSAPSWSRAGLAGLAGDGMALIDWELSL